MSLWLELGSWVAWFFASCALLGFFKEKWSADLQARVGPRGPGKWGMFYPISKTWGTYRRAFGVLNSNPWLAVFRDLSAGLCAGAVLFIPRLGQETLASEPYSLVWLAFLVVVVDLVEFFLNYTESDVFGKMVALHRFRVVLKVYLASAISLAAFVFVGKSLSISVLTESALVAVAPSLVIPWVVLLMCLVAYTGFYPYGFPDAPSGVLSANGQLRSGAGVPSVSRKFLSWVLLHHWLLLGAGQLGATVIAGIAFGVLFLWILLGSAVPMVSFERIEKSLLTSLMGWSFLGWIVLILTYGIREVSK